MAAVTSDSRPAQEFDGGRPMTILEHLQELRTRLVWCMVGLIAGIAISAFFTGPALDFLTEPMKSRVPDAKLIFTKPLDGFTQLFRVTLLGGLIVAMPVFVYQALLFVVPGLTPQERRWVLPLVFAVFISFLAGAAFCYYIILPPSLDFLLGVRPAGAEPQIIISDYLSFATRMIFWVGVTFELPLLVLALARFGLVSARQLIGWWRYVLVLVFVVAAFVTPTPDPLTQTLVAGPMIVLYIVGIILAALFGKATPGKGRSLKRLGRRR